MTLSKPVGEVAIVGCGLTGLCLALCLHLHSIPCVIYEQRPQPSNQCESTNLFKGGSIALFPNSLSVLDALGIYDSIHQEGFDMDTSVVKNEAFETIEISSMSNVGLYGYKVLLNLREVLLRALLSRVQEEGVPIHFNHKFSHVVSESESTESVTFEFANSERRTAKLLVGADGIHSRVRRGFTDAPSPVYHGTTGLTWSLPRDKIRFPDQNQHGNQSSPEVIRLLTRHGMVLLMPLDGMGNNIRIGVNLPAPDRDRDAWEELSTNKNELLRMLAEIYPDSPDVLRSAIEGAEAEAANLFLWPMRTVPLAPTWISKGSRIIFIGDAAHGFPPSGGQGGGMGIEDAYTLAFVLSRVSTSTSISHAAALEFWQKLRKERASRVVDYVAGQLKSRLPGASLKDRVKEDDDAMFWLYGWKPEDFVRDWTEFEQNFK